MDKENKIYEAIKADFYQKHKTNIEKGDYDQRDVDRLKADINNDWMKAMYRHGFSNHDKTVAIMHDVLAWRKDFEANDLLNPNKLPFPQEYFNKGSVFYRNEDINCNPILHFAVRLHKKGEFPYLQVCKFIAYHFELAYKFNETDPIVLLFDMYEAGYSNLDMDMIKFVISCLKTYYPGLIDYMVVFQMPFIFNAAWKIIKNWLPPEGVKLIKFVDKKSIREYIQESQLFVHMGGTDPYKYSYDTKQYTLDEEALKKRGFQSAISMASSSDRLVTMTSNQAKQVGATQSTNEEDERDDFVAAEPAASDLTMISVKNESSSSLFQQSPQQQQPVIHTVELSRAEVNFTLNDDVLRRENTADLYNNSQKQQQRSNEDTKSMKSVKSNRMNGTVLMSKQGYDVNKASELNFENNVLPLLSITPNDELVFQVSDGKADVAQFIKLTNTSGISLAYKIKITSPDKFRVKPGTGIIQTSSCVQIMISFLKEFHLSNVGNRDKFLILWTPIDEQSVPLAELNDFWKQVIQKKTNLNEHKIKCVVMRPSLETATAQLSSGEQKSPPTTATPIAKLNQILGERLVGDDQNLSVEQLQKKDAQLATSKIFSLEINMMSVLNRQNELLKQQSMLMFLIFFLILLNLIQFMFQTDLFNRSIEPAIRGILFSKP